MKYLLSDIGSTYTKVVALDLSAKKVLGFAKSFTTIEDDVEIGFNNAISLLREQIGDVSFDKTIVSSSAKGGLKMISVGLVPSLTVKAAQLAATSAGAKLYDSFSYELTQHDIEKIVSIAPEIVLLTGGIDGGNKEVVLNNARLLADTYGDFAVVYAGNSKCVDEIELIFKDKKQLKVAENVMPVFNKLNIEPAKDCIRELFIENIILAKGLDNLQSKLVLDIVPTPLAFMSGLEMLSTSLGKIMAFDLGGATSDVYSINPGTPTRPDVHLHGFLEPVNKRTVEGDIGMRYSLNFMHEQDNITKVATTLSLPEDKVLQYVDKCIKSPWLLPSDELEQQIEKEIAKQAILESCNRHSGYYETSYTLLGEISVQFGKDLTNTEYVIGAGGSIVNGTSPKEILEACKYELANPNILKPINPKFLLDTKNLITSIGLMRFEPKEIIETAVEILQNELVTL